MRMFLHGVWLSLLWHEATVNSRPQAINYTSDGAQNWGITLRSEVLNLDATQPGFITYWAPPAPRKKKEGAARHPSSQYFSMLDTAAEAPAKQDDGGRSPERW